jgi:hypothetical protein
MCSFRDLKLIIMSAVELGDAYEMKQVTIEHLAQCLIHRQLSMWVHDI